MVYVLHCHALAAYRKSESLRSLVSVRLVSKSIWRVSARLPLRPDRQESVDDNQQYGHGDVCPHLTFDNGPVHLLELR
jgi:hypothetical protein